MKTGVTVADAMSPKPIRVDENTDLVKCAKLMLKKKVGSLLVVKDKKLSGLLTEKDIVGKVVAKNKDAKKIKAKDVMTKKLVTIRPDIDIDSAMKLMRIEEIRRLPVVSKDRELLGLLTIRDILNIQSHLYEYIKEKAHIGKMNKKQRYIEGECESCGTYGRLYEVEGDLLCEACRDEKGKITELEAQTED